MEKLNNFDFQDFIALLMEKDTLLSIEDAEEFFEEIYEKLDEESNVFEQMGESKVFDRIVEILVFIPANTLLGLKTAKIIILLKCDNFVLKQFCHYFSRNLIVSNDYYDISDNNFITKNDDIDEDDEEEIPDDPETLELLLAMDSVEDFFESKDHYVEAFIEKDDFDLDDYDEFVEF